MNIKEVTFESSSGEHDICGRLWKPVCEQNYKGVVQIAHGMSEHMGRYDDFARFLVSQNYVVCANDHIRHGLSANGPYGLLEENECRLHMVEDMHRLHLLVAPEYENLPYVLLGHSMGSFLSRIYATRYSDGLDGIIYSGTGSAPLFFDLSILLCKLFVKTHGGQKTGTIIQSMMTKRSNKRFQPIRTAYDWLTTDTTLVDELVNDPACGFAFTYTGYLDLFLLLKSVCNEKWAQSIPRSLPTLLLSGTDDPVGGYGSHVEKLYQQLLVVGLESVTMNLYPDYRHCMLYEVNKQTVFADVAQWLDQVVAKA